MLIFLICTIVTICLSSSLLGVAAHRTTKSITIQNRDINHIEFLPSIAVPGPLLYLNYASVSIYDIYFNMRVWCCECPQHSALLFCGKPRCQRPQSPTNSTVVVLYFLYLYLHFVLHTACRAHKPSCTIILFYYYYFGFVIYYYLFKFSNNYMVHAIFSPSIIISCSKQ